MATSGIWLNRFPKTRLTVLLLFSMQRRYCLNWGISFFLLQNSLYQRSQTITRTNRLSELPRNKKKAVLWIFFTSIFPSEFVFKQAALELVPTRHRGGSACKWTRTIPVTLNTGCYAFVFESMRVLTFNSTPCLTGRMYRFNTNWLLTASNCPPSCTALP